ncbi:hypothetical protein Ndes2526B_g01194 [Nannochloris sp. 'desiccata']|nr:hypothetical protein NADE_008757 [Chlorella desiccata (nom. nud.)]
MVRPVIRVPFTEENNRAAAPSGNPAAFEAARSGSASQQQRLMSKVPSLLFEMEDAEEPPSIVDSLTGPPEMDVARKLHTLLDPWTDQEYMLNLHVRIAGDEVAKRGAEHLTVGQLADTLRKLGYPVKLRTALGGGWGGNCLRNLRHSFLAVTLTGSSNSNNTAAGSAALTNSSTATSSTSPCTVLVDPRFREQFEIAHPTPRYARILAEVPAELVAPADRLSKAVELLCTEMAVAFAATGTPVPPWRQAAAMMSKWQPRRSEEVDVSHAGHAMDAAALNNAAGGVHGRVSKLTGGNSVAQKLAMLGVEPATASPISEGMEELDSWSMGTDEEEEVACASGDAVTNATGPGAPPEARSSPNDDAVCLSLSPEVGQQLAAVVNSTAAAAAQQHGQAVWNGIREAVAAQATRSSTWN